MLQKTVLFTIRNLIVLLTQSQDNQSKCCKRLFQCLLEQGTVLHTQAHVHDSKCCNRLFICQLVRGMSYPGKLRRIIPDVAKTFLPPIGNGGVLPTFLKTVVHNSKVVQTTFLLSIS